MASPRFSVSRERDREDAAVSGGAKCRLGSPVIRVPVTCGPATLIRLQGKQMNM